MLRTKQYWLCAGAVCCSTPAVLLFSPIILKLGMERGLDEGAALWSVVLGSVGSAAGRLLMPLLSDKIGRTCRIVSGKKKGRIELDYYGIDDLNDLLEALAAIKRRKNGGE